MISEHKTTHVPKRLRELSDKELNEITRAVGDRVRAQTIEQKERMKASLQKELAVTRAAYTANERKRTKA
jgi:two-component SAPR family response regulator